MIEQACDDTGPAVSWSDGRHWVRVEFSSPRRPYRDATSPWLAADTMLEYIVKISGPSLAAEAPVMSAGDGSELPDFIQELTGSFRGWRGTRTWESLEHQLQVAATWADSGHVRLKFQITPSVYDQWKACVVVPVEAGAEMQALGYARRLSDLRAHIRSAADADFAEGRVVSQPIHSLPPRCIASLDNKCIKFDEAYTRASTLPI